MKKTTMWDEMRKMQKGMDSLFNDFFYNDKPYLLEDSSNRSLITKDNYREPIFDLQENEKEYFLTLEIPGSKKEDIKININDDNLEIKVENKQENKKEDKEKGYYSYQRSYCGYYRSFVLPKNTDQENIDAEYKDGVLNLKIPKKNQISSQKQIEVK